MQIRSVRVILRAGPDLLGVSKSSRSTSTIEGAESPDCDSTCGLR
ncbi:hypothetical protein I553_10479 [Mycobacterium xenopi 4042]|uniref:Uncharacterized protein n=1 Tax=Mycobacterium xenopi 4042 TaxID=1299334 RepID=X8DKZ4_MYCXE|nr:hypothetical protein I553_10479 [Mycobacterium xenopi 4042]